MISLYGGRLLLFCDRADRTWHCRVALGPKPEHQLDADTGAIRLQDAMIRAQSIYQMALANHRPVDEPRMCWDCVQWNTSRKRCDLELPEARQSGGRFAAHCSVFLAANR